MKLYKSRTDVKVDGVCAGLAKYFKMDVTIIRIIWVVFAATGGSGVLAYFICALIMPREPFDSINPVNNQDDRSN